MGARGRFWQRAVRDESGATMVEYSFMAGLIAMVAMAAVAALGLQSKDQWEQSQNKIGGAFSANAGSPSSSPGSGTGGGANTDNAGSGSN
ncbi:Flp family type IVb pilin [Microvirga arabica]|nr:Flp family type IVb pilin [Microvirga arabica]MBM1172002.1 Flp family type IVb pilin [Microvirga arabica]